MMENTSDYETIELHIPKEYFKDKNTLLGAIIRNGKNFVFQSDSVEWDMKEFGSETPISNIQLQELLWMNRPLFSFHFDKFKKVHGSELKPLFSSGKWGSNVYPLSITRAFISYMNRNGNKFNIEL